jgi:hypothetical protein
MTTSSSKERHTMTNVITFPINSQRRTVSLSKQGKANGRRLHPRAADRALIATTPCMVPNVPFEVSKVCRDVLGCPEVRMAQVVPDPHAVAGDCAANVARRIAEDGGIPVYGWKIRASLLFVSAEFYTVVENDGKLFDVTPSRDGEALICFAPDPDVSTNFDFRERPSPVCISTYAPPTRNERIATVIAGIDRDHLEIYSRRAARANLSVNDLLALEIGEDALSVALDRYIECSDEVVGLIDRLRDDVVHPDSDQIHHLMLRRSALEAIVRKEWEMRQSESRMRQV